MAARYLTSKPSSYAILAGTNLLNSGGTRYNVAAIHTHPGYNPNLDGFPNDIAIVELESDLPHTTKIQSVALEPNEADKTGHICVISGWGYTTINGTTSPNALQKADRMKVLPNHECQEKWGHDYILGGHICVDDLTQGACNGDSGGPLVCWNEKLGVFVLSGLTSWGFEGCDPTHYPSVYSRIGHYAHWIEQISGVLN